MHTGRVYTDTVFRHDTMGGWAGGANETNVERTKFWYDFRGNVQWEQRSGVLTSWGDPVAPRSDIYYVYDQRGLLTSTIAPRGNVAPDYGKYYTIFTYDGLGRLETTTEWLRDDIIGGSVFPRTRYTVNFYDDQNRRTEVRHANGLVTTTHFNRAGERTFVQEGTPTSLAAFGTTEYNYDAGGQLRAITDSTGRRQVFFYDAAGRLAARVDGDGTLTEFIHDNRGYLVTTIAYSVRLTQSRLDSLVDGFGLVTATLDTVRDEADGVPADDRVTRNVYDAAGRLVFEIDAIGAVTRHVYDGAGQLLASVRHADRVSVARNVALTPAGFDDIGSQYYVEPQADDRPSRNFFDRDGLLVANLDGDGFLVKLRYDGGNRLISRTAFANQAAIGLRATGTLAELEANIGTDTGTGDDVEVDASEYYFYDGMGRRIGVLDAEGYFTETVYNLNSEVTQVTRWDEQNAYGPSADTFAELRALVAGFAHAFDELRVRRRRPADPRDEFRRRGDRARIRRRRQSHSNDAGRRNAGGARLAAALRPAGTCDPGAERGGGGGADRCDRSHRHRDDLEQLRHTVHVRQRGPARLADRASERRGSDHVLLL